MSEDVPGAEAPPLGHPHCDGDVVPVFEKNDLKKFTH